MLQEANSLALVVSTAEAPAIDAGHQTAAVDETSIIASVYVEQQQQQQQYELHQHELQRQHEIQHQHEIHQHGLHQHELQKQEEHQQHQQREEEQDDQQHHQLGVLEQLHGQDGQAAHGAHEVQGLQEMPHGQDGQNDLDGQSQLEQLQQQLEQLQQMGQLEDLSQLGQLGHLSQQVEHQLEQHHQRVEHHHEQHQQVGQQEADQQQDQMLTSQHLSLHNLPPHDPTHVHDLPQLHNLPQHGLQQHDLSQHDLSQHDISQHDLSPHELPQHDRPQQDLSPLAASPSRQRHGSLEHHIQQHFQSLNQTALQQTPYPTETDHNGQLSHTLSAISAFNASYDTNQWNKRPSSTPNSDDGIEPPPAKRHQADIPDVSENVVHDHSLMPIPEYRHEEHGHITEPPEAAPADVQEEHHHHIEIPEQSHLHSGNGNDIQHSMDADVTGRLPSEEVDYEEDDEADGSPFQSHRDHVINPFGPPMQDWAIPTSLMDDSTAVLWSANHGMRVRSLPVVDNLSTQILLTLGKGPYQETLNIVTCPESDSGQAYSLLKSLFDQTKKIYTQEAFLSAEELKLDTPEQRSIIRKVNLATFVSSVFGSQEVGFFHLNECFLDTFVPDGGRLLKSQGALYLDLKTQAYISALSTGERDKVDILNDLFPDDIHHHLLVRRPGAKGLTPSEADFVQRAHQRKQHLIQLPEDAQLSDKYVWQDFLQDVSSYVSKHYEQIMTQPVRKNRKRQYSHNGGPRAATAAYSRTDHTAHNQQYSVLQHQPVHMQLHTQPVEQHQPQPMYHQQPEYELPAQPQPTADDADAATAAALSAHNAAHTAAQHHLQHHQEIVEDHSHHMLSDHIQPHESQQAPSNLGTPIYDQNPPSETPPPYIPTHAGAPVASMSMGLGHPPIATQIPAQTTPTQVLYERARLAAQSKASPNARRSGLPSQRRPWTPEEETALMAGLDRVKGPHWSQILAMFGPGGTINEVLKDRNQVQLKDKARNLKLFFLKSGIEVPYYLQFVTGELKTRAPSQAAKQQKMKQQMVNKDGSVSHSQYTDGNNGSQSEEEDDAAHQEARAQARAQAQAHIDAVNALNGELNRHDNLQMQQALNNNHQATQENNTHHGHETHVHSLHSQVVTDLGDQDSHMPVDVHGLMLDNNSVVILQQALMLQQQQEEQQRKEEAQHAQIQQQMEQLQRLEQQHLQQQQQQQQHMQQQHQQHQQQEQQEQQEQQSVENMQIIQSHEQDINTQYQPDQMEQSHDIQHHVQYIQEDVEHEHNQQHLEQMV